MMNIRKILCILIVALMSCSCSGPGFDIENITPADFSGIAGKITDYWGKPIEHIKVTINIDDLDIISAYTSSKGIFIIPMDYTDVEGKCINILIEDIDGNDNGGFFQTKSDIIQADSFSDGKIRISLDYRLSPSNV